MPLPLRGLCPLIQVFDMPTSLRFYREVLGFTVIGRSGPGDDCGWIWLKRDDAELMLNTAYEDDARPSSPDPARAAAHADTTLFFGCPDLDQAYAHLRALGVAVERPVTRDYGMRQIGFSDPDGYGICLQWPAT
jgi:catechol 2,3-dioxygenase-like lactoylglutathione lyase family enzyme